MQVHHLRTSVRHLADLASGRFIRFPDLSEPILARALSGLRAPGVLILMLLAPFLESIIQWIGPATLQGILEYLGVYIKCRVHVRWYEAAVLYAVVKYPLRRPAIHKSIFILTSGNSSDSSLNYLETESHLWTLPWTFSLLST